jgi:hypothetical protein
MINLIFFFEDGKTFTHRDRTKVENLNVFKIRKMHTVEQQMENPL